MRRSLPAKRDTRERILDAAQGLLESGGLARLTTKAIARQAACAEGTLFKHFKSKEDLCLAVVVENAPKFMATVARTRAGHGSVQRNLETLALACIKFSEQLIPLGVTLLADTALLERHRTIDPGRGAKHAFESIASYVAAEQEIGRINPRVRPVRAALLLFGPCFHRVFIRQVIGRSLFDTSDRRFAGELASTIMRGLSVSGTMRTSSPITS